MKSSPPQVGLTFVATNRSGHLLHLHVVPGAAKTELAGLHGTRLKIRVKAPPSGGAANQELLRFLADLLDTAPTSLAIVRGASDRRKTVSVPPGIDVAAALRRGER